MYTEFILIFAGLGVNFILLVTAIILIIIILRKSSGNLPANAFISPPVSSPSVMTPNQQAPLKSEPALQGNRVVFCKNCYTQFDSSVQFCPKCGTPKN